MAHLIQKAAPLFSAEAVDKETFKIVSLENYRGKYVVLLFYPLDFTFVCPTELCSFSDRIDEFRALDCEVLGVSIDSKFSHLAYNQLPRNKGGLGVLNYPLIADVTKSISKDYGVLIEEGPDAGVALRGLFIISDKGILRSAIVNDLPVGRSCDEILRLVQAFQFTDEHGEVCPADWKPGKPTMKASVDSEQTKKYWEEIHDQKNSGQ